MNRFEEYQQWAYVRLHHKNEIAISSKVYFLPG